MAMDPFRMNSKETFKLKPCPLMVYPSQYSVSARWSTRRLLKFPYISVSGSKPTGSSTLNDHATSSSRTAVLSSDKNTKPLSYSVYQKLRSCIRVPVLLAETNMDVPSDGGETRPDNDIPLVSQEEIMEYIANETGTDRLRDFYYKNPQGGSHPDFEEILMTLPMSAMLGMFLGFYTGYRKTTINFKEDNRGTTFRSKMNYQRMRIDKSIIGGMKTGAKGGLFLGSFVTLLMGISKCISTYRNKTSFMEYSIAASVTGAVFRLHLGPKGLVAGGVAGLTLGALGGLMMLALAKATGETQENRHYRYIEERLTFKKQSAGLKPMTELSE